MLVVAVRAVDDHLRNRGQLLFSGGQVPFGLVDDEHVLLLGCLLGLVSWVRPPFRRPLQDAHLVVFSIPVVHTVQYCFLQGVDACLSSLNTHGLLILLWKKEIL